MSGRRRSCGRGRGLTWLAWFGCVALSATSSAWAATGEGAVIEDNGPPDQVIDLVYVAEGYVAADKAKFLADAKKVHLGLVASSPFAHLRSLLSARAIFVASAESGSDHPSKQIERDTAFDSTFDSDGIGRLLTAHAGAVQVAANTRFPAFDIAILIVNDTRYGGSGGAVPMISVHPASVAILQHEIAHNLGDLADEYTAPYPGFPAGDFEPNVVSEANLKDLPWTVWVSPETAVPTPLSAATGPFTPIGAYEGARYLNEGMFRPAPTCIMRNLASAFCPVCAEALVLAVAAQTTMLRSHLPAAKAITCDRGACPTFSILSAGLATETISWSVDGVEVGTDESWTPPVDLVGDHEVEVRVQDTTGLVRADPTLTLREVWRWDLQIRPAASRPTDGGSAGGDAGDGGAGDDAVVPSGDVATAEVKAAQPTKGGGCAATSASPRAVSGQGPGPLAWSAAIGLLALGLSRRRRKSGR